MSKRGLSSIVSTLLILLLVFVAVGIVWVVIRNVINEGTEQVSLGKFTLDLAIEKVQVLESNNQISLTVKRNPGQGDFVSIQFIFSDGDNSEIFDVNGSLQEHQKRTYDFNLIDINVSNMEKVEIAPVFRLESGKEVVGDVKDTWNKASDVIYSGSIDVPPVNNTGGECTVDSNCTADYYSNNFCSNGDVYRNLYDFSCNSTNQCSYLTSPELVQDCTSSQTCVSGACVDNAPTYPPSGTIVATGASVTYEVTSPTYTLDEDLSAESRWSGFGEGAWISYDFNQTVSLDEISIYFYQGDSRVAEFSIDVSLDNSSWTRVLDHQSSSGTTLNFETFNFALSSARYLRIVGHGNSVNDWNSIVEVNIENFASEVVIENTNPDYECVAPLTEQPDGSCECVAPNCHIVCENEIHDGNWATVTPLYGIYTDGAVIRNCTFRNYLTGTLVYIEGASNILIEDSTFENLTSGTSGSDGHAIASPNEAHNIIVRNNVFRNIGGDGFQMGHFGADGTHTNIQILDNLFEQTRYDMRDGNLVGENAIDLKTITGPVLIKGNTMRGYRPCAPPNECSGSQGEAMGVHFGGSNVMIDSNIIQDSVMAVSFAEVHNITVRNNFISEVHTGVAVNRVAEGVVIEHNTIAPLDFLGGSSTQVFIGLQSDGTDSCSSANNLLIGPYLDRSCDSSVNDLVITESRASQVLEYYSGDEPSENQDLHLATSSATEIINQGSQIGVTSDFDGDVRDSQPDIGADEYVL